MTRNLQSRMTALEGLFGINDGADLSTSPELVRVKVTAQFAADAFGHPAASQAECFAKLYGLRSAAALRPWLHDGVGDVVELARRDYEPEFGDAWREEWVQRLDEVFVVLEGRFGRGWPDILTDKVKERQGALVH